MRKKILGILILVIILVSGCGGKTDDKKITEKDVRKGTDGIAMSFVRNTPPEMVFEDSDFPVGLTLQNKGAFDVGSAISDLTGDKLKGIIVFGFEKRYASPKDAAKEEKQLLEIKGKSIHDLIGGEEYIKINAHSQKLGSQSQIVNSVVYATTCYPYNTIVGDSVCIDTDVYGTRKGEKACIVSSLSYKDGQGAPVAITDIETTMLPQDGTVKPMFIIDIENKGNGEVLDISKISEACSSSSFNYTGFNRIRITATLSGKALNCKFGSADATTPAMARLKEGEDTIICILDTPISANLDPYVALLKVELDYGYTSTISKEFTIEKIGAE